MNNHQLEIIEKYLKGQLSRFENNELNQLMENDSEFRAQFMEEKLFHDGILYAQLTRAKNDLVSLEQTMPEIALHSQIRHRTKFKQYGIAALIGLFIIAAYFLIIKTTPNHNTLFEAHFNPFPNEVFNSTRGNQAIITANARDAFALYDDGHYHEAAQAFNSLLLQKDEQLIRFYYANALMASGEVPESIKQFEIYLEDNPILKDEATWYVALGYLHENQKDKTSAFLMDLTNLNTALGDQATDLLNEMR